MSQTEILTTADDSAGRDKQDYDAVVDLDHEGTSSEWNKVKNGAVAMSAQLGLGDGSTADSLTALLASWGKTWRVFDDFDGMQSYGWTSNGTGTESRLAADQVNEGHGIARIVVTVGNTYEIQGTGEEVGAKSDPRFYARVRGTGTATRIRIGLIGDSDATYIEALGDVGVGWTLLSGSNVGGASGAGVAGLGAFDDGEWHDVRMELDTANQELRLYIDDVLVDTATTTARIPQGADRMGMRIQVEGNSGTATVDFDYVETRGTRL